MRIKIIDGLRGVAVLGVLWTHIWMFSGNASLYFMNINIAKLISFCGTGVDLFFVISGFCMFLLNHKINNHLTLPVYWNFIKKRWLRIAFAFYVAVIIYGLNDVNFNFKLFDFLEALKYMLFLRNYFGGFTYAPHFWSIATEWQFYLLFPLLLFVLRKFSFSKASITVIICCIFWRLFSVLYTDFRSGIIDYSLPSRLIEFAMGIVAAKIYLSKRKDLFHLKISSSIIGILIAFLGRFLMSDNIVKGESYFSILAKVFNIPILSLGFAILILSLLNQKSIFTRILESYSLQKLGKYSYSLYLWHWLIAENIFNLFDKKYHIEPFIYLNLVFVISLIILLPISKLSYIMFEAFYFKKTQNKLLYKDNKLEVIQLK